MADFSCGTDTVYSPEEHEKALVRCLEREIAFSVLIISFSVLILLSPHFWKDVSLHVYTVSVWVITIESMPKNNMCVCKH